MHCVLSLSLMSTMAEQQRECQAPPRFLVRVLDKHVRFALPELVSVASIQGLDLRIVSEPRLGAPPPPPHVDVGPSPFAVVEGASAEQLAAAVRRCVLTVYAVEIWASGETVDQVAAAAVPAAARADRAGFLASDVTFAYECDRFAEKLALPERLDLINRFSLAAKHSGKVRIKQPDQMFYLTEDWGPSRPALAAGAELRRGPSAVWFGRLVATGARDLQHRFSLKKRWYLGPTSMDAELAFVMANMARVQPGSLFYDPFVGTGSTLVAAAYFGAYVFGSDLDGRYLRRVAPRKGVPANLDQYGLLPRLGGLARADLARLPWRRTATTAGMPRRLFDAICCDPPYGIRAGAKTVGPRRGAERVKTVSEEHKVDHIPQRVPYPVAAVLRDLLQTAVDLLVVGGRLVFWLPTTPNDLHSDLPSHPCLRSIDYTAQVFTDRWARRLVTLEKVSEPLPGQSVCVPSDVLAAFDELRAMEEIRMGERPALPLEGYLQSYFAKRGQRPAVSDAGDRDDGPADESVRARRRRRKRMRAGEPELDDAAPA